MSSDYGDRTSTQRLWLAGAVGLVGVLLVGGGWLVWQGLTRPAVSPPQAQPAGEAQHPRLPVAWGAPDLVDDVPWGFPLTADGAATSANRCGSNTACGCPVTATAATAAAAAPSAVSGKPHGTSSTRSGAPHETGNFGW